MRTAAFAIALMMSSAAIAQTTTQPDLDVDADVSVQPDGDLDIDADVDATTTNHSTMTTSMSTTAHTMTSASGQTVQPSNANPERDARGIAVISDPAFVPAGWNGIAGTAMGGPLEETNSYPACSRTVTDNCLQTYERGRRS